VAPGPPAPEARFDSIAGIGGVFEALTAAKHVHSAQGMVASMIPFSLGRAVIEENCRCCSDWPHPCCQPKPSHRAETGGKERLSRPRR